MKYDKTGELARPISATIFEGVAARVHLSESDGLKYTHGVELRDADGLRQIVDQLPGAPVNVGHDKSRVIGKVIAARLAGDQAVAQIVITDERALASIKSSHTPVELSLGYAAQVDDDGWQRTIVIDHLAVLVDGMRARCGDRCRVETDAAPHHRPLTAEQQAADALRERLRTAWSGAVATTIPTKKDAHDCACSKEPKMSHEDERDRADRAAFTAALVVLDPQLRTDELSVLALAQAVITSLGEINDDYGGMRFDQRAEQYQIAYARGAIISSRHRATFKRAVSK